MIDSIAFSWAGDKYLGIPYSKMDCQAFVEACMADVGYRKDLPGSNSWYRYCIENGWVGSPEDCKKQFGSVPKGCLIFILEPVNNKTPEKFKHDGVGDATHMGIKTGRNDGAIHSSYTRQCVCTSVFEDKTIKNGGWKRVGLLSDFDYGKEINEILTWYSKQGGSDVFPGKKEEEKPMEVVVSCPIGETVKLRQSWNESSSLYGVWDKIVPGTKATILGSHGDKWKKVRIGNKDGWMMSQFLVAADIDIPPEDPDEMDPVDSGDDVPEVNIKLSADEASTLFVLLKSIIEQIDEQIGEG